MRQRLAYPAVTFLVRFGGALAVLVALVIPLVAMWNAAIGGAWWGLPVGLAGGCLAFLLLRSYVELVRIIADTLLPR